MVYWACFQLFRHFIGVQVQESNTYRRVVVIKIFGWYLANVHLVLMESGMTAACLCRIVKCFIISTKQTWLACDSQKKKKEKETEKRKK